MNKRLKVMGSIVIFGLAFVIIQYVYLFSFYDIVSASSNLFDHEQHACTRDCSIYPEQRTCTYSFTAEWYFSMSKACYSCPLNKSDCHRPHCIPMNGVQRPVLTINRQVPGPSIQVCQGDRIQVKVINAMDNSEGITLHWHGQHQRHSPHMDGTEMITQCPIPHRQTFTYDFIAETPGTHWWHSHSGLQRADGVYGSFIVRQNVHDDVHSNIYDIDDSKHVIVVSDWTEVLAMQHMQMDLHADGPSEPDGILINGRGVRKVFTNDGVQATLDHDVFTVTPYRRHRFRTINTAVTNCPLVISVQEHTLTVIASDGAPTEPILVDGYTISGGERYDFVLDAIKPVDNYWLRVRGVDGSECGGYEEMAILRYEGALQTEPRSLPDGGYLGIILNLPSLQANLLDKPRVDDLRDAGLINPAILKRKADVVHYIEVDSVYRNSPKLHHPIYYPVEKGGVTYKAKRTHMLDNITFALPPGPVLSHHAHLPDSEFCSLESLRKEGKDCTKEFCHCIHTFDVKLNQVVELVLVTKSLKQFEPHPMHLHGNHFYVISTDNGEQLSVEQVKEMDSRAKIKRNLDRPPRKDTIMMSQRYVIIRFKADNPGWWLFHCHMDLHQELGMAAVFHVGKDSDLPLPPMNMPVCVRREQQAPCKSDQTQKSEKRNSGTFEPQWLSQKKTSPSTNGNKVSLHLVVPVILLVSLAIICAIVFGRNILVETNHDKISYRTLLTEEIEMCASS